MTEDLYRHYFDIDPEYFPQVNEAIIAKRPDIWKKYYPHETFVKLIKDTVSVLSRQQKASIWVEGAYGTGKSHAVLTLKKLLDASEEDTHAYFAKYPDQLPDDLYKKFQRLKSDDKKILTVHRYGSSKIDGDNALTFALQESITRALEENGYSSTGNDALRAGTIEWLSQPSAKLFFNSLIKEKYSNLFGGDDTDAIIEKLKEYKGDALITLMTKITKVGDENRFSALTLDVDRLVAWIKEVIQANNLKAIVFIWDEFTNYFEKNLKALTGFQQIVEISATDPFYLIIVTHKSAGLFSESDKDQKRILDRFVKPTCNITLPENMAFRLMGSAMVKVDDPIVREEWDAIVDDLYSRTDDSRKLVKEKARISDKELQAILPIHPYAALLLKHISSAFDSNQRSMFDFIKNDRGDEIKGFQWFIDNYGPEGDNPFLTVDALWDFFYEKGKEYLSSDIRSILDCYSRALTKQLTPEQQRVLKTVLLMEAISRKVGDSVELFIPNEKNINNAFEGSDLDTGAAAKICESLCKEEILYRKPLGGNKMQYSAMVNVGDISAIEKNKEEMLKKSTASLITEGEMDEAISLTGALKLRYKMKFVSSTDLKIGINALRNEQANNPGKIAAVVALAKNETESANIAKAISSYVADSNYNIVFIDASITPLGKNLLEQYAEAMANSKYQNGKDNSLSSQYARNAREVLKKWRTNITTGGFIVSYRDTADEVVKVQVNTEEQLLEVLKDISKKMFCYSLETGTDVIDNMWQSSNLKAGVECGATQITKGTFTSKNEHTKLENYIGEAWQQPEDEPPYWEDKPYLLISRIKNKVVEVAEEAFQKEGRVSIARIYDSLKVAPFGFLPCNLTAFVMGFVLKEYLNGVYSWSDGMNSDSLTELKLKEMVNEVIALQNTPNSRYRDKYIVMLTPEEKAFNSASSQIFNIPLNQCTSVEQTRERIRNAMKLLSFPVWSLKYLKNLDGVQTEKEVIERLIDLYTGIVNSQNIPGSKSESDFAMEIGKICIENKDAVKDAVKIFSKEHCIKGMQDFLEEFEEGILPQLAQEIGDNGQYINALKNKFDADAANWVWNKETAEQKIKEIILEYKIIAVSNRIIGKNTTFKSVITDWCDRSRNIRLSYAAAKNNLGDLTELLRLVYEMKKTGTLLDSQKQAFYDALVKNEKTFMDFYVNGQLNIFKELCEVFIEQHGYEDDDVKAIYNELPANCLVKERQEYYGLVENKMNEFDAEKGNAKLKNLWREKTGTDNPKSWSQLYKMPILCMIDDDKIQEAKAAFITINSSKADANAVEKAINFLECSNLFVKLNSAEARDNAFKEVIIKQYATLLTDVKEVKDYLSKVIKIDPYDWYGIPEIDKKLCKFANMKYNQGGCDKALEKIDSMQIDEVKHYLKDLIKDNMMVGMVIIKGK